jgi:hypothetical protein
MPCSFVLVDDLIVVLVHVPLIKEELRLFRPRVIPYLNEGQVTTIELKKDEWIGVTQDLTRYILLDGQARERCHTIGDHLLCGDLILRKNFNGNCLAGLYSGSSEVQKTCKTSTEQAVEEIVKYGKEYVGFFPTKTEGQVSCHGITKERVELDGLLRIKLAPGCALSTGDSHITSKSREVSIQMAEARPHETKVNLTLVLESAMWKTQEVSPLHWVHHEWSEVTQWILAAVAVLLGILISFLLCYLYVRAKRSNN